MSITQRQKGQMITICIKTILTCCQGSNQFKWRLSIRKKRNQISMLNNICTSFGIIPNAQRYKKFQPHSFRPVCPYFGKTGPMLFFTPPKTLTCCDTPPTLIIIYTNTNTQYKMLKPAFIIIHQRHRKESHRRFKVWVIQNFTNINFVMDCNKLQLHCPVVACWLMIGGIFDFTKAVFISLFNVVSCKNRADGGFFVCPTSGKVTLETPKPHYCIICNQT